MSLYPNAGPLFAAAEGERLRDEVLARVSDAAKNSPFIMAAHRAVATLASTRVEFTTDDVWALIGEGWADAEPRALGAVMRGAARAGLIERTDRVRESSRPSCHRRPVAVWRSAGGAP